MKRNPATEVTGFLAHLAIARAEERRKSEFS